MESLMFKSSLRLKYLIKTDFNLQLVERNFQTNKK